MLKCPAPGHSTDNQNVFHPPLERSPRKPAWGCQKKAPHLSPEGKAWCHGSRRHSETDPRPQPNPGIVSSLRDSWISEAKVLACLLTGKLGSRERDLRWPVSDRPDGPQAQQKPPPPAGGHALIGSLRLRGVKDRKGSVVCHHVYTEHGHGGNVEVTMPSPTYVFGKKKRKDCSLSTSPEKTRNST